MRKELNFIKLHFLTFLSQASCAKRINKVFLNPSEIPEEKREEYYCIKDIPIDRISSYGQGYFVPEDLFFSMLDEISEKSNNLQKELKSKEIEYDKLKRKYDLLLDKISSYEDNGDSSGILL